MIQIVYMDDDKIESYVTIMKAVSYTKIETNVYKVELNKE